ncbi:MAG: DNA repair protein RadA [Clostridia bacterium]|nr:DNA repair protein RadA [Clostridia bacterium]MCI8979697.1 DNA repair protein RadA [Clostridia bacterium]MCI9086420.1 DNA repair protein RadA [Clostridia bacterium]NDO18394.1 DNA repair protein RadA [Lachnospiraceae bacterium MD329]
MKSKTTYICRECGYKSPKWLGKCPSCNSWNTMDETLVTPEKKTSAVASLVRESAGSARMPKKISEVTANSETRYKTGLKELDRVLGGGIVRGSLILVGGDPGIGKSTLLLQICQSVGESKKILYVSGEESEGQIKIRAERLGVASDNLYLVSETDVSTIIECINSVKPDVVIIDSIQTMNRDDISSAAGSVPQVREATNSFMRIAKTLGIAFFIVGHVTKEGAIAGPRVLEHMVDCVLYFEGDRQLTFRILRAVKNRFGSTNEIGVFEMRDVGLIEVENPSAMLLEGRNADISGSAIVCAMEGSRGVMAEIQALVTPTGFGNPRRMANGIDLYRLLLLIAVLEKRARMNLSNSDVYLNIAGGLKIDETAVDLGICAAVAASQSDIPLPSDMIFIGEVGLGGELRGVSQLEKRISEAAKLGFTSAIVPKQSLKGVNIPDGFAAYGIRTVSEMINMLRRK